MIGCPIIPGGESDRFAPRLSNEVDFGPRVYFFAGGDGTLATPGHFPLPELLPIRRPEASRLVLVAAPAELPLMVSLPLRRPEASRNWVLLLVPADLWVLALPARRPLASR